MDTFTHSDDGKRALIALTVAVAKELGWQADTDNNTYYLGIYKDSQRLSFGFDSIYRPKRLTISCRFPQRADGTIFTFPSYSEWAKNFTFEISVAWNREPKAIAAEIKRRLLPHYEKTLAEAQRQIANEQTHINDFVRTLNTIRTYVGRPAVNTSKPQHESFRIMDNPCMECNVSGPKSIMIMIDVESADEAVFIMNAVKALR